MLNILKPLFTFYSERKEYIPSLLHFAAAHGLRDLTAQLLNLPGSVKAFGTPNCNGDYPSNLAENNGHTVLKEYMDNYMVSVDHFLDTIQCGVAVSLLFAVLLVVISEEKLFRFA